MKKKTPAWIILMIFCLVAAAALALTNLVTKDVIAGNAAKESMQTRLALLPGSATFEDMENGVSVGLDEAGNIVGYAGVGSANGFGGEVESTVVLYPDGTIAGISVGGANFAETAGLGAKAKEPEFAAQFVGKSVPVELTQNGGEIDALSGATITSRAVIKGVNNAVTDIAAQAGLSVEAAPQSPEVTVTDGKYTASADGFGGPVAVTLGLDENNTITSIEIGDKDFAETAGLGAKAQDQAFKGQFIGKTLPVAKDDIDMISGATITSNAVLTAIDKIANGKDNAVPAEETEEVLTEETEEAPAADAASVAKTLQATEEGFGGDIEVKFGLDENNTVVAVEIGGKYFAETEGVGSKVKEPAFTEQFVGKTLPIAAEEVDMISGATVSSKAVVRAIEKINSQVDTTSAEEEEPAADTAVVKTLKATEEGFGGDIEVTFGLDENNTVVTVEIGGKYFAETEGVGSKVKEPTFTDQFVGKTLPIATEEVDMISGATVSSKAVVRAIEDINAQIQ